MSSLLRTSMRSFATSIFSHMTQLADRHGAINLAQGFPDFDPPEELLEAGVEALLAHANQYSPSAGLPDLREAIAVHQRERYGLEYDADTEITVTMGATEALWCVATALLEPGDEAIVIEPFYETYPPAVVAAGGVARFVTTSFPGFRLDLDRLEESFSDRTRLVFLNTPTNPTGRLLSGEEARRLGELAEKYDAYLVSDETYEHVTFEGAEHVPVAVEPACRARTITVSSVSKTFSATGWRLGWAMAPAELTDAVRKIHQFVTFAPTTPLQRAVGAMFRVAASSGYYDRLRAEYDERRATLLRCLEGTGLEISRPLGTYFVMTRCGGDDVAFVEDLITRVGVAAIPASVFYHDRALGRGLVRFAFCKRLETLEQAGERLRTLRDAAQGIGTR
jgi:N-succinyldiaminopimelate aminotransferase